MNYSPLCVIYEKRINKEEFIIPFTYVHWHGTSASVLDTGSIADTALFNLA